MGSAQIISCAVGGLLNINYNTLYLILTDDQTGFYAETEGDGYFCDPIGGFHFLWTSQFLQQLEPSISQTSQLMYAMVGNPSYCGTGSEFSAPYNQFSSPNADVGVDGMITVIAHEIAEAMTDANGYGGWRFVAGSGSSWNVGGGECADLCIGRFGNTRTDTSAPCNLCSDMDNQYNLVLNSKQYLVQQLWANLYDLDTGACSLGCLDSSHCYDSHFSDSYN